MCCQQDKLALQTPIVFITHWLEVRNVERKKKRYVKFYSIYCQLLILLLHNMRSSEAVKALKKVECS